MKKQTVLLLSFLLCSGCSAKCQTSNKEQVATTQNESEELMRSMIQRLNLPNAKLVCFSRNNIGSYCTVSWFDGAGGTRVRDYWCTRVYCTSWF